MRIVFANDRDIYNLRYRHRFIEYLKSCGHEVVSIGYFDNLAGFIRIFFHSFLKGYIVSSNLKSNLITMMFPWARGLIIINGLGRFRANVMLRRFLILLIEVNGCKHIVVQNYADYRYFRLHTKCSNLSWIPGSGGTAREVVHDDEFFAVSRDEKVVQCIRNSSKIFAAAGICKLTLVGSEMRPFTGSGIEYVPVGYVPQHEIFRFGQKFVQLMGYGEGVPHTLVDAIVSGLTVYMAKSQVIQFGLHKLGVVYGELGQGIVALGPQPSFVADRLGYHSINSAYMQCLKMLDM